MSARSWILIGTGLFVAAICAAVALTPQLRERIQSHFFPDIREILATAEGPLLADQQNYRAIKIKSREGLSVEVLRMQTDGNASLVARLPLPDRHDGYFNLAGHVTRLAIVDLDLDGVAELIAPTFDQQLVPHLNVFRYNASLGRFEPYPSGAK